MNENTKILFLAALILVVAIVSFNLNITGMASKGKTSITVTPANIVFGKYDSMKTISVAFKGIGTKGIDEQANLYRETGERIGQYGFEICGESTCYKDVTKQIRIGADLEAGKYYYKAQNARTGEEFKSNLFTVKYQ